MAERSGKVSRGTKETSIEVVVNLDGPASSTVSTGLPFFDHMLDQLARHGGLALEVKAKGDLEVDAHHTVEDVGLAIGTAIDQALGDRTGIARFASVTVPLDEALVEVVLDVSGRPFLACSLPFAPETPGLGTPPFDPQLTEEFLRALTTNASMTVHVTKRAGRNTHHVVEATFKAFARALRAAVKVEGSEVPSTKGVL